MQFRISFDSIDRLLDATRDGVRFRDITTGPVAVFVYAQNEFFDTGSTKLESNPLRLRYRAPSDGEFALAAAILARDAESLYSISLTVRYRGYVLRGDPVLGDVPGASGSMLISSIKDGVSRRATSKNLVVTVRGMRTLTSGFEE